jgi:hypothetical protein
VRGLDALLSEFFGLFLGDILLAGKRAGAFERRQLGEVPDTLQIRTAVRGTGNFLAGLTGERNPGGDDERAGECKEAHTHDGIIRPIFSVGRRIRNLLTYKPRRCDTVIAGVFLARPLL